MNTQGEGVSARRVWKMCEAGERFLFPGVKMISCFGHFLRTVCFLEKSMRSARICPVCWVVCLLFWSSGCATAPAPKPPPAADYDSLFRTATRHFLEGNYVSARIEYERFLKLESDSPRAAEARYRIGLCYLAEEHYEDAHRYFDMAVAGTPDKSLRALAMLGKAEASFSRQNFKEALESYRGAMETAPIEVVNEELLYRASVAAQRAGEWDIARHYMQRIVTEFPDGEYAEQVRDLLKEPGRVGEKPYAVQVGAFSKSQTAESLVRELKAAGLPAYVQTVVRRGRKLHCVRVGPYATWLEADAMRKRLNERGYEAITVP